MPVLLKKDSFAYAAYEKEEISERHRHRFEFNNSYRKDLESAGLIVSGANPDRDLVEIVEVQNHPWFVGGSIPSRISIQTEQGSSLVRFLHRSVPIPKAWQGSRK